MPESLIRGKLVFVVIVILLSSATRAAEVAWIGGGSYPPEWSIQPGAPQETDTIRFSGPARFYLNRSVAERELGGQPVLRMDFQGHEIELRFEPPARGESGSFWNPVCGLEGSFGPLEAGQWRFFCTHSQVAFSLSFEVGGPSPTRPIYYVDARATGANDGASWTNAFVHLQDALAAATHGCEIRVAMGVYRPDQGVNCDPGNLTSAFHLKSGVVLKGGYAGAGGANPHDRNVVTYETILSGDLAANDIVPIYPYYMVDGANRSDNSYHVVVAAGVDSTAVLDGFTITGGHAFGSQMPDMLSCGGGIYNDGSSPIIRHCLITGNAVGHYGAGIYSRSYCTLALTDCVIADNWSQWWGGGLFNEGSDIRMERCLISGNGTRYQGAGIHNRTNGDLILSNCIISGNLVADPAWGRGGALYCFLATAWLNHCTLTGNTAALGMSLACDSHGQPDKSAVHLSNCILWDSAGAIWNNDESALEIVYSDVQSGWPGAGNIDMDPCFIDLGRWESGRPEDPCDDTWVDGNYRLAWESSCVDVGDPCEVPATGGTDFAGRPRRSGPRVDMGAHELTNEPPVANAGPDVAGFSLTGEPGSVTLDAGRSSDPEGRPLTFRWYREGQKVSNKIRFTTQLPLGEHRFKLFVNDGVNESAPDEVVARVTRVIETTVLMSPVEMERSGTDKPLVALAALPPGRQVADFDAAEPMLLFPGGIKSDAQTTVVWRNGKILVLGRFDRADIMAAVPQNGPVEMRLVGRLKDGRYFSGADTVRIK